MADLNAKSSWRRVTILFRRLITAKEIIILFLARYGYQLLFKKTFSSDKNISRFSLKLQMRNDCAYNVGQLIFIRDDYRKWIT